MIYIVVGAAGAVGALLRFYIGAFGDSLWHGFFPFGTLLVNFIGCFALGWLAERYKERLSSTLYKMVAIGLIGSFTTFSAFSVETVEMFKQGEWLFGAVYVLLSMWGGLLFVWLGVAARGKGAARRYDGT